MRFSSRWSISASQRWPSAAERKCIDAGALSGDHAREPRAHAVGERLVLLRAAEGEQRPGEQQKQREQGPHRAARRSLRNCTIPPSGRSWGLSSRRPLYFRVARGEPALGKHHAVRDADQLHVGEQHPGALVAVVHQHVDPWLPQLGMQAIGGLAHLAALVVADRHQAGFERRDRRREDDAARVVVLLDRRGHDARHADAVATHLEGLASRPPRSGTWRPSLRNTWCAAGKYARPRCRARSRACPCRPGSGRRPPRCGCRPPAARAGRGPSSRR